MLCHARATRLGNISYFPPNTSTNTYCCPCQYLNDHKRLAPSFGNKTHLPPVFLLDVCFWGMGLKEARGMGVHLLNIRSSSQRTLIWLRKMHPAVHLLLLRQLFFHESLSFRYYYFPFLLYLQVLHVPSLPQLLASLLNKPTHAKG